MVVGKVVEKVLTKVAQWDSSWDAKRVGRMVDLSAVLMAAKKAG